MTHFQTASTTERCVAHKSSTTRLARDMNLLMRLSAIAVLFAALAPILSSQVAPRVRAQNMAINVAIGAATSATWSALRGRGFSAGIRDGIAGGAVIAIGKQVAASPFEGSGFFGREMAAIGVSLITSAGREHVTFSLPIGPGAIRLTKGEAPDWRINAVNAIATVVDLTQRATHADVELSLSSGTFVFRSKRPTFHSGSGETNYDILGTEYLSNIMLSKDAFTPSKRFPNVLYHENVHVLQEDFLDQAIANPIEDAILSRTRIGRRIVRHIDIGLLASQLKFIADYSVPYASRPWEREAYALTPLHNY